MAGDAVTIALDGDVPLAAFAEAVSGLVDLLRALGASVHEPSVTWELEALERSSAIVTARGVVRGQDDEPVRRVVQAFETVGRSLQNHEPVPFAVDVRAASSRMTSVLSGRVRQLKFETDAHDYFVTDDEPRGIPTAPLPQGLVTESLGAVEGRIQTLSNRGTLRFTLYDTLNDKAVGCYLQPGQEGLLRQMWGQLVIVQGTITRNPRTGRPSTIRDITAITTRPDVQRANWAAARGALGSGGSGERPEVRIRRLRDA